MYRVAASEWAWNKTLYDEHYRWWITAKFWQYMYQLNQGYDGTKFYVAKV